MLDKAIEKLKAEIDSNKNNEYIKFIGAFLIQHLTLNPVSSENVLKDGKTIKSSLEAMKDVARKKATAGWSMLTDEESFQIVLKYFEVKGATSVNIPNPIGVAPDPVAHIAPNKKPSVEFNVELDF